MKTGKVKFFNESKGFGFIIDNDSNKEIFVHISEIVDGSRLNENDNVRFEVKTGQKGLNAVNVEKI
jgi:CspA family cold shock protein